MPYAEEILIYFLKHQLILSKCSYPIIKNVNIILNYKIAIMRKQILKYIICYLEWLQIFFSIVIQMETGREMISSHGPSFRLRYTQELDLPEDFQKLLYVKDQLSVPAHSLRKPRLACRTQIVKREGQTEMRAHTQGVSSPEEQNQGPLQKKISTSFWGASQVVLVVKNLPENAGDRRDSGSIPGWGRSPGEGNGNPVQYSCLENPTDGRAW